MSNVVTGENFKLTVSKTSQDRIKSDLVKDLLTPDQLRSVTQTIDMEVMKSERVRGQKPDFVKPTLGNATLEGLVDMLGDTREKIKELEKYEGIYKDAIKVRLQIQAKDDADAKAAAEAAEAATSGNNGSRT